MEHVELQGVSIVLLGNFNPSIFNPDWLAAQGVLRPEELTEAHVEIIHPEIAQFTVGDLNFEVHSDRFVLHALAEPFVRTADIVMDVFGRGLAHTPIKALGINYLAHFKVRDWKQQNALGRLLAPIAPWGDWGKTMETGQLGKTGGMTSLTMQQPQPDDREAGYLSVTIQPSNRIEPHGTGVFMQINDHYEATDKGTLSIPELCVKVITPSLERSRHIVTSMSDFARTL